MAGLRTPSTMMLGGVNPTAIPATLDYFQQTSEKMLSNGELVSALRNYEDPQGYYCLKLSLLKKTYGWDISSKISALPAAAKVAFLPI